MASSSHKFQAPKGTRDFYPADLALRRYIENVWRTVSINHGFEEVDGPMFEHVELYTAKSGPAIVNEIFGVFSGKDEKELEELKRTGRSPYALRPEFTPTLARMVAAKADALPKPVKWFCMPNFFRAERPQRGRLREFQQWNVDILGDDSPKADAEIIACAVGALERLGLTPRDVRVRVGDRRVVVDTLKSNGLNDDHIDAALILLDRKDRLEPQKFADLCHDIGLDYVRFESAIVPIQNRLIELSSNALTKTYTVNFETQRTSMMIDVEYHRTLINELIREDITEWCEFDFRAILRGLAYYTGTVFEIHEATGAERAIAGGGRYDKLVEVFGGPSTPACGFAMGDVVLSLVLKDKGLLKAPEEYLPRPHAFVIAASDESAARIPGLVSNLRRRGFHVRCSYKTTRNVGKLLGEASKARALCAIILGDKHGPDLVDVKDLQSGAQGDPVSMEKLPDVLQELQSKYSEQ